MGELHDPRAWPAACRRHSGAWLWGNKNGFHFPPGLARRVAGAPVCPSRDRCERGWVHLRAKRTWPVWALAWVSAWTNHQSMHPHSLAMRSLALASRLAGLRTPTNQALVDWKTLHAATLVCWLSSGIWRTRTYRSDLSACAWGIFTRIRPWFSYVSWVSQSPLHVCSVSKEFETHTWYLRSLSRMWIENTE